MKHYLLFSQCKYITMFMKDTYSLISSKMYFSVIMISRNKLALTSENSNCVI